MTTNDENYPQNTTGPTPEPAPAKKPVVPLTRMKKSMTGMPSLFRGKIRRPVSITLTPEHHFKVKRNVKRLGLTRSDLIGLLIEKYADAVTIND